VRTFDELFREGSGFEPFPYQRVLACADDLPALVRVPTGAGKTAGAVFAWIYRRRFHSDPEVRDSTPRRLVYCLPMRVLVEQVLTDIRAWIGRLGLDEEVGVYQLMGGALESDWVGRPEREAILVGTMDMLLSRALNRGYAAPRSRWPLEFGLLNNDCLWVLDEVQLMGNGLAASAQLSAFRAKLGTSRPCRSLWMSATVDRSWLQTVDHDPPAHELSLGPADLQGALGTRLRAPKTLRRLAVKDWPEGGAEELLALHRVGSLTLVIVNTVGRARRLHDVLRRAAPRDVEVLLLHSRFRPPDRRQVVKALLAPAPAGGRILVSTQVVEAGVDISAAALITELAPWTSIVQRLGRCNRYGEFDEATVAWVDLPEREAAPYEPDDMAEARERLAGLEGQHVGPLDLTKLGPGRPPRVRHVVRRLDLLDLFDTEPDLAGNDVDVSRFIRDDADVDVHVFWRRWPGDEPPPEEPEPHPDELCPVPAGEVRGVLQRAGRRARALAAWTWDHLQRRWRRLDATDLRPGMVVLFPADAGLYDPERGWDGDARGPVPPLGPVGSQIPPEGVGDEPPEEVAGAWVRLEDHLTHVRNRLAGILHALPGLPAWQAEALRAAALWHDVGKAHRVFQEALQEVARKEGIHPPGPGPWAKSPATGRLRYERPHFRHELASALALLAAPPACHGLDGRTFDLAAYLAAAHHGKVRLAIRSLPGEARPPAPGHRFARGVWDGDELPPIVLDGVEVPALTLDLSLMEAGRGPDGRPSWAERALRLRDELGPFRLAYLEAILRAADWEASADEGKRGGGGRGEESGHA